MVESDKTPFIWQQSTATSMDVPAPRSTPRDLTPGKVGLRLYLWLDLPLVLMGAWASIVVWWNLDCSGPQPCGYVEDGGFALAVVFAPPATFVAATLIALLRAWTSDRDVARSLERHRWGAAAWASTLLALALIAASLLTRPGGDVEDLSDLSTSAALASTLVMSLIIALPVVFVALGQLGTLGARRMPSNVGRMAAAFGAMLALWLLSSVGWLNAVICPVIVGCGLW